MITLTGTVEKLSTKLKSDVEYLMLTIQVDAGNMDPTDLSQLIDQMHSPMVIVLKNKYEQVEIKGVLKSMNGDDEG